MAGFTTYLQQKVLDHVNGKTAYTMPTTYVGLFTAPPTDAGGGTEVSGGSYARAATSGLWNAASGTSATNSGAITFPAPTASWGSVTYFGVFDASAAGNLLYWAALTTAKTVNSGDAAPYFPAASLTVSLD